MTEKTAKALYALLKELYQSRTAKEFVDVYGREEREQRHEARDVPVNWSVEKDNAYHELTEAIFKRKPLLTIQKAATTFVEICKREERKKPETGDVYQDIFGNKYVVVGIHNSSPNGELVSNPFVALMKMDTTTLVTVGLEEFMNPTFKKV